MPNPRPGFFTTGGFESREDLRRAIFSMHTLGFSFRKIADHLGVSDRTVRRIHAEMQTLREEARKAAYAAEAQIEREAEVLAAQTGLKPATIIYAGILIALLLFVAMVAIF